MDGNTAGPIPGRFEHYIRSGQSLLRCGYTTGTCAALAAVGAARLLFTGKQPECVSLTTPKGVEVTVTLAEALRLEEGAAARCAVVKDGGDDHDITNGMWIRATVRKTDDAGIRVDGGEGVGRVTRPGLDQPVGAAAINRVPRKMIERQVQAVCDESGYDGGVEVVISVPGGAEAAKRTFNPMLGVTGGISILGTSGIVEPMSEQAIVDTIAVEQRQAAAAGAEGIILTPGNYGMDFLRETGMDQGGFPVIKCSNFIGEAIDIAVTQRFQQILLVGHMGKLVKLAGGIMNTHSRYADCRTELFCAHAALCGAGQALCRQLMRAATTDACIKLLDDAGLRENVMERLLHAIQSHLDQRAGEGRIIGAVVFSNEYGLLGETRGARRILEGMRR